MPSFPEMNNHQYSQYAAVDKLTKKAYPETISAYESDAIDLAKQHGLNPDHYVVRKIHISVHI